MLQDIDWLSCCLILCQKYNWAASWQNQQCGCAPSEDSDQLGIRPVWSESSLSAWRKHKSLATHWAHSEDSDQTGRMPRQSESSLGAHSLCWFCHEAAHLCLFQAPFYFSRLWPELFCLLLGPPGFNCWFSFAPMFQWCCSTPQGSPGIGHNTLFLSSPHLCFIIVFICDLFNLFPVMIHWRVRKPSRGPNNYMFWAMTETDGDVGIP